MTGSGTGERRAPRSQVTRRDRRGHGTAAPAAHARAARAGALAGSLRRHTSGTAQAGPRRPTATPPATLDVQLTSDDRSLGSVIAHDRAGVAGPSTGGARQRPSGHLFLARLPPRSRRPSRATYPVTDLASTAAPVAVSLPPGPRSPSPSRIEIRLSTPSGGLGNTGEGPSAARHAAALNLKGQRRGSAEVMAPPMLTPAHATTLLMSLNCGRLKDEAP